MKIIQLNIWQGKIGRPIADFLKAQTPDIVCMQEVNDLKGGEAGGPFATLDEIKEWAGFTHVVMAPTYGYRYMRRTSNMGNAILSRSPAADHEVVFINDAYHDDFDFAEDDYNIRNMQICRFDLDEGKHLTVVNHHSFHIIDPKGNQQSVKAMQKVVDQLSRLDGPLLLCGDFNVNPESAALQVLSQTRLRNLTLEYDVDSTLSRLHKVNHPVVCDYIFASPEIKVKKFEAVDPLISDHKALILEFEV